MTKDESRALADWVVAAGKNVTAIFVTHAHGDHLSLPGPTERTYGRPVDRIARQNSAT
jgi:glyoxylase-like metal-dependent hydrolase (beta-lactamase superfamily II)